MIKNYSFQGYVLSCLFLFTISFTNCNNKSDNSAPGPSDGYLNRPLQGNINQINWIYQDGLASSGGSGGVYHHSFRIYDSISNPNPPACIGEMIRAQLLFSFSDSNEIISVGKWILDESDPLNTVVFNIAYKDSITVVNSFAHSADFEILSVDTTTNVIVGQLKATSGSSNSVNGTFTIKYCDY